MPVKLNVTKNNVKVMFSGDCTVVHALEMKNVFLKAIGEKRTVLLDFSDVSKADLSTFQLICAAHLSAQAAGVDMDFSIVPMSLATTMEELGFSWHKPCSHDKSGRCLFCLTEATKGRV